MNDCTVKISVCNRKTDKRYKNQEKMWSYLTQRNRTPLRTTETAEEYPKLAKQRRDDAKDHGECFASSTPRLHNPGQCC